MKFRLIAALLLAAVIGGFYLFHASPAAPDSARARGDPVGDARYRIDRP